MLADQWHFGHSTDPLNVLDLCPMLRHRAPMVDTVSPIFAALADPTRRAILALLLEDDMAVTDVAAGFDLSLAAISKHLGVLGRAGLISQERRGRVVWCKLEPDTLRDASVWMQAFGQFDGPDLDALEGLLDHFTPEPDQDELLEEVLTAEKTVWTALVTGDAAADSAALAPDFLGVYPDGYSDRSGHVAQLADGPTIATFTLSQARVRSLAPDLALLSYHAAYTRSGGHTEAMWVSSLWRRVAGGWINLFSQDTPAQGLS